MRSKLLINIILFVPLICPGFDLSLTENGQRTDGSKLWDIGYNISALAGDSLRITLLPVTEDGETLTCETFIAPSDTGFVSADGDYHIVWDIGTDVPSREFYDRRIVIYLTAARPGVEPGVCNDILDISAGDEHSMILRTDGTVWTFGSNDQGQIGDMTLAERHAPVQVWGVSGVGLLGGISDIACGHYHNVAVGLSGNVYTWGKNHRGQLGNGVAGGVGSTYDPGYDSNIPVFVRNPTDTDIHENGRLAGAGKNHVLLAMADGQMTAWGYNLSGQLGNGISGGSGDAYDDGIDSNLPLYVEDADGTALLENVVMTASGAYHSLALLADGTVRTWGSNYYGQLGLGIDGGDPSDFDVGIDFDYPQIVYNPHLGTPLEDIVFIAAGDYHSLAINSEGIIYSWGRNNCGQIGGHAPPSAGNQPDPVRVGGGESGMDWIDGMIAVDGGRYHTVALRNDGTVWTWGDNFYGQLGNGGHTGSPEIFDPGTDRFEPIQVWDWDGAGFFEGAARIAAGSYHSLANTEDGRVWGWGNNERGQLGDGTTDERHFPTEVVLPW